MAILLLYPKISETQTGIEYQYRPGKDQLDGRLALDPADPRADPLVGAEDPSGQVVAGIVISRRLEELARPEHKAIRG